VADFHGFGGDAVAVGEQLLKLSLDKAASQKIPEWTKRQFVVNAVLENADAVALRCKKMGVLPSVKRAGKLDISELASLDVVAMLKNPADAERAKAHAKRAAVAIANPGRAQLHFDGLPRRSQSFERAWLSMPSKDIFGTGMDLRARNKLVLLSHPLQDSSWHSNCAQYSASFWAGGK
jgi:hypothetical protein